MRVSWPRLPPSSAVIDSSALYVARRVTAISDFIWSLYASTCRSVMLSWSSSDWYLSYLARCSLTSPSCCAYCGLTLTRSLSACSRSCEMIEWFSCTFSRFICSFASCCWTW